jgi:hypothetical protein
MVICRKAPGLNGFTVIVYPAVVRRAGLDRRVDGCGLIITSPLAFRCLLFPLPNIESLFDLLLVPRL